MALITRALRVFGVSRDLHDHWPVARLGLQGPNVRVTASVLPHTLHHRVLTPLRSPFRVPIGVAYLPLMGFIRSSLHRNKKIEPPVTNVAISG